MQKDSIFSQIGSPEFESKYVCHGFPPVASMAAAMLKVKEMAANLQEMKIQLEDLREEERTHTQNLRKERENNRMSPG